MGFLLLHSYMQIRHAFPGNKKQLLQLEGRVLLVYSILIAITVSFLPKGFQLWHTPLHVTIKRWIMYCICSWNNYCMCTPWSSSDNNTEKLNSTEQKCYFRNTNGKCNSLLLNRTPSLDLHLESKWILGGKYFIKISSFC